jgi:hypothetical protein
MNAPKILVREDEEAKKRRLIPTPDLGWYLLGAVGLVFAIVGGIDIALVWYPSNLGNPEFEFGSVAASFNNLPLVSLGLTMWMAGGVARGQKWVVRAAATALIVLALLIVIGAVLFLTNVPMALKAKMEPIIMTGLKKGISKTLIQSAAYPVVLFYVAVKAWRHSLASTTEAP